jgi:ABC-type multidrug transport system ATPase subunit
MTPSGQLTAPALQEQTDTTLSPPVRTSGLTKRYGARTAVDSLDVEVPHGAVAGFVGPNGAGKTTTLRMLLGLVRPSAGHGQILGRPLTEPQRYLARVGALIESPAFYPGLSGKRNLAVLATLGGFDKTQIPVSFEVPSGSVLGLLGPNGSGKTTTVSILSTALRPGRGKATVCGFDVLADGPQPASRYHASRPPARPTLGKDVP